MLVFAASLDQNEAKVVEQSDNRKVRLAGEPECGEPVAERA
jgi:hypothetical protein